KSNIIIVVSSLLLLSCVPPQLPNQQANRIAILEQRIVALEQEKQKSLSDLRSETSLLNDRVQKELENFRKSQRFFIAELDSLKKDASLITNDNEKAQSDIRKNSIRIQQLQKRLGDQILALDELKKFFKSSIDTSSTISAEEKSAFDKVFRQYKKKNFKVALQGFEEFRRNFPDSELIDDTMFYIAYTYFLTGQYNVSSLRFFELLEQYPGSKRVNDAKWWLGISLERTGDINGALDLYRELSKLDEQDPLRIKAVFRLEELQSKNPSN
ncbi:outer membrane protein assembly factor BamD, partial [bacterium]|nr:outer membrane protein assembly factor BamD [bacterium]